MKLPNQAEVCISHRAKPTLTLTGTNLSPASSKLDIFNNTDQLLTIYVRHRYAGCFLGGRNAFQIELVWKGHVHHFGSILSQETEPKFLTKNKAYIRQDFLDLLRKLCRSSSHLTFDKLACKPTKAQRALLISSLNSQVILGFCQILGLPITRLPKPIYAHCMLNNL